ncbi:MAG: MotA/TolQ/ExbB proton channel family protein [Thermoguttaceae bacterium]
MYFARRLGRSWFGRGLIIFAAVLILVNCATIALAQESGTTERAEAPQQSVFAWFIECSGFIGLIILILSVYFVALVARMFLDLRMQTAMPPEIIAQCEAMLEQRDFKGIFNVVKEDDSFFSRVLVTGITELPNGLSEAREAMERIGEMLTTDMEKKISPMAVLGTLGPMIGLLGTLSGMIKSFGQIARSAGQQIKSDQVAKGISEALLLTFEGVALSLPAIAFFSFFRNRALAISVTTMTRADEFLRHFAQAARGKPSGGAAVPAARAKA